MKTMDTVMKETDAMARSKEDFLVSRIHMEEEGGKLLTQNGQARQFDPNDWALGQLFGRLGMPGKYFSQMYSEGEYGLVADHANHHLERQGDRSWFVRSRRMGNGQDNICRALLTERYSTFDNEKLVEVVEDFVSQTGTSYEVKRWQMNDKVMRLFITYDPLEVNVGKTVQGDDDVLRLGTFIQNSEVGYSSIHVRPMILRLICSNGLMGWGSDDEVQFEQRHTFQDADRVMREVLYALNESLQQGQDFMNRYMETKHIQIANPAETIKQIAQSFGHTNKFTEQAVEAYSLEPDGTGYGVINAFTRAARDLDDDRRVEIERDAGSLVKSIVKYAA